MPKADKFLRAGHMGINANLGADAVAAALGADWLDAQPVLVVGVVAVENNVRVEVHQEQIGGAC